MTRLLFLFLFISITGIAQQRKQEANFQKIDDRLLYDDTLIQRALLRMDQFYWEYRYRKLDRFKLDSLQKLYWETDKSTAREKYKQATALDYSIVLNSTYKSKNDSIRISTVNTEKGPILSCLPNGDCFYYLIAVRNDSTLLYDERASFRKFFLPIDSYEKAVLWSMWHSYSYDRVFPTSGSYRITPEGIELLVEKILSYKSLKGKRKWLHRKMVALVLLKINTSGTITETQLKKRKSKREPTIMI